LKAGDRIAFGRRGPSFTIRGINSAEEGDGKNPVTTLLKPSGQFGFEPNNVMFAWGGVGARAASRLAGKYQPIQVISMGGMGKIILVQEITSGRFVALKIMLESTARDASLVQQFVREAVITARLQHPHIIPVHDLGFFSEKQLYYT